MILDEQKKINKLDNCDRWCERQMKLSLSVFTFFGFTFQQKFELVSIFNHIKTNEAPKNNIRR